MPKRMSDRDWAALPAGDRELPLHILEGDTGMGYYINSDKSLMYSNFSDALEAAWLVSTEQHSQPCTVRDMAGNVVAMVTGYTGA